MKRPAATGWPDCALSNVHAGRFRLRFVQQGPGWRRFGDRAPTPSSACTGNTPQSTTRKGSPRQRWSDCPDELTRRPSRRVAGGASAAARIRRGRFWSRSAEAARPLLHIPVLLHAARGTIVDGLAPNEKHGDDRQHRERNGEPEHQQDRLQPSAARQAIPACAAASSDLKFATRWPWKGSEPQIQHTRSHAASASPVVTPRSLLHISQRCAPRRRFRPRWRQFNSLFCLGGTEIHIEAIWTSIFGAKDRRRRGLRDVVTCIRSTYEAAISLPKLALFSVAPGGAGAPRPSA